MPDGCLANSYQYKEDIISPGWCGYVIKLNKSNHHRTGFCTYVRSPPNTD